MMDREIGSIRALFVVVLMAGFSVSAASDGKDGGAAGDRAGRTDAATYVAVFGTSEAEAVRRLKVQEVLGGLELELRRAADDVFAGLWIEHQPEFSVEVRFTDVYRGRQLVDALASELAGRVAVRVDWADTSLSDLEALQERALRHALAAGVPVDADIDVRANRVELMATDLARLEAALGALSAESPDRLVLIGVDQLAQPEQLQPLRGGRPLSTCTTGFTVRHNSSGQLGALTAAHCGNSQTYWDTWQSLPFRSELFGGSHDVQWHSRACNMTVPNEFDSGIGVRQVTGTLHRDQQLVNSMVCRNGMATTYRCGFIHSKNFRPGGPNYPGSWNSTFIRVRPYPSTPSPFSAGGDSGGPWFLETVAYGVHSGRLSDDPLADRFYTAINYVSNLGVSVLTYNAGTGSMWTNVDCYGNYVGSFQVSCHASPQGGVPPYSYQWSYSGDAASWSSSGGSAWADYGWPGCPDGGANVFLVQATDSCGQSSWSGRDASCSGGCPPFEICEIE